MSHLHEQPGKGQLLPTWLPLMAPERQTRQLASKGLGVAMITESAAELSCQTLRCGMGTAQSINADAELYS